MKLRNLMLVLAAAASLAAQTGDAGVMLQRAIRKESVEGDLKGAIELYKKVVAGAAKDRAAAAKALLRLGECYEKQGNAEARRAYERLVKEFSDQKEQARDAGARLAAMGGTATPASGGMSLRLVDTGEQFGLTGGISSDGRLMAFTDYQKGGSPAVYDTAARQVKLLADFDWGAQRGFGDQNAISRDGKWVAFNWYTQGGVGAELRVVGTDGTGMRTVVKERGWTVPQDWTPDGRQVVAHFSKAEKQVELCLVGVADGNVRVLKQFIAPPRRPRVSPDGKFLTYIESDGKSRIMAIDGTGDAPLLENDPRAHPMDWTPDGRGLVFASERSGAHALWHVGIRNGRPEGEAQMLRAGLTQGITPAGIGKDGRLYFVENSTINNSYTATLDLSAGTIGKPERTTPQFEGMNGFAAWSPDGRKFLWVGQKRSDNFAGGKLVIRDLATGRETKLEAPEQAVGQSAPDWMSDSRFLAYRADDSGKQMLMRMDTETGESTRIVEGRPPWNSVLTRDGKTLLFSKGDENVLMALDTQTGVEKQVASFPKEVWARSFALSPDERTMAFAGQYEKVENGQRSIAGFTVEIVDLGTGQSRVISRYDKDEASKAPGFIRRPLIFTPDGRHLLTGHQGGK